VRVYTGNRQSPVIKGTFDPMMAISVIRWACGTFEKQAAVLGFFMPKTAVCYLDDKKMQPFFKNNFIFF
jgi:hypothetical protein